MFEIFGSLKSILKVDEVKIDNALFKLQYRITMPIMLCLSALITSRQYFGDPIDCIFDKLADHQIMDTYCWMNSFIVLNKPGGRIGVDMAHPNVGTYVKGEDLIRDQQYYQWVCFVLFFQAALFYIPRYLWKSWDNGRIRMLTTDVNCPIVDDACRNIRKGAMINYIIGHMHLHNMYALKYIFCEILNGVNVFGQMYYMNCFLGGEFIHYGYDIIQHYLSTSNNPVPNNHMKDIMNLVFPKTTKCSFDSYGPSGTIQTNDGLCVLPLNIVNEKIYAFIWFWFVFLAVLHFINFFYRLAILVIPKFRFMLLRSSCRTVPMNEVTTVVDKCDYGDWFLLYLLSKNMNPLIFSELISNLSVQIKEKIKEVA